MLLVLFIFIGFIKFYSLAGAYDDEEAAARAYDLAALKYWGPGTLINFPVRKKNSSWTFLSFFYRAHSCFSVY